MLRPAVSANNHKALKKLCHSAVLANSATLIRSERLEWDGEISVVYQSIDGLREAMPAHTGDWYFTGRYPTPGGYRVLNTAYLNWRRQDERRAY